MFEFFRTEAFSKKEFVFYRSKVFLKLKIGLFKIIISLESTIPVYLLATIKGSILMFTF